MKNRRSSEAVRQVPMIEQCSEPDNSQILVRRSPGKSDASRCGVATAAKAPRTPVGLLCRMQRLAIARSRYIRRDTTLTLPQAECKSVEELGSAQPGPPLPVLTGRGPGWGSLRQWTTALQGGTGARPPPTLTPTP